jgi:predicted nucleic acid-binding protein
VSEFLLKVVVDACVLFRAAIRDTLLRAAEKRLYQVYWSEMILQELKRNLIETEKTNSQQADRLVIAISQAFPDAIVQNFEPLISVMNNDQKDRHVLAAAVKAEAQIIVTSNLTDFPDHSLTPFRIKARSPDQFLKYLFSQNPQMMTEVLREQAAQMKRPAKTVSDVLNYLAVDAPNFVELVRFHLPDLYRD